MANKKENPKNSDSHVNLFEQNKRVKASALETLTIAKEIENKKFAEGFRYVKIDAKTTILKKF